MKKAILRTNVTIVIVLAVLLVASLVGAVVLASTARAQNEQPTSVVTFTSSTTVMKVGDEFEFAALVTNEDGTTSTEVVWSSSNEDVIYIEDGLAIAVGEGTVTVTATAEDGAYASIDVYVSESAVHVDSITLYPSELDIAVGWKTRISYTILPENASDQRVTWKSSDPSALSIDDNGNVEALAAADGITITATTYDSNVVGTATVNVYDKFQEATLDKYELETTVGQVENNEIIVTAPAANPNEEGVDQNKYQWYAMYDDIASFDPDADSTGTVFSWSLGTTKVYVVITTPDGTKYGAEALVHVTEEFFYIGGLESVDAENPWKTYANQADAQAADVLLVPSESNPYIYTITREFWAFDDFQILNNTLKDDEPWPTVITSTSFVEEGSSMLYIANTVDMFRVNALGSYTVQLDLSNGHAKVTIIMESLEVTSFELSVATGSEPYLQGADSTMVLDAYTIPEAATVVLDKVTVNVPSDFANDVDAEPRLTDEGKLQVVLTLKNAYETSTAFELNVQIENSLGFATDDLTITILADGESYVEVSSIVFTSDEYIVNVNNGAQPWISSTPIEAVVNSDASVQGVVYFENSDEIYIEYIDDKPYVHAAAIGNYTVFAYALGNRELEPAKVNVYVTSLIEPDQGVTETESGFYLIGILDGTVNWTSIVPEKTNFVGTDFVDWQLPLKAPEDETTPQDFKKFSRQFHFMEGDRFSIAFLGMDGNWNSIINEQYFDWTNSRGNFYENNGNVEITISGNYTIELDMSGALPSFTARLVEADNPDLEYRLYYYIVRSGDAWNSAYSEEQNMIAEVGYFNMLDGVVEGEFVFTMESAINFYDFYKDTNEWPTIQFVSAIARNYGAGDTHGIVGGYFQEATWYGSAYTVEQSSENKFFSGDAYSETGEADHFTNYNAELYWVSSVEGDIPESMNGSMTVSFTFKFNDDGILTGVELNFVSATASAE